MQNPDKPIYQLTRYPIGSLREIWAVSWPLMIGLFSASLMLFADRLILAHYSLAAMNACATAGIACWCSMVLPIVIAETTEVFVGRANGEGNLTKVGSPVWQMIWLTCCIAPLYWIGTRLIAPFLFNLETEICYYTTILDFAPFFISSVALAGFFIGTGRMHIVTYTMFAANLLNIVLTIFLVFPCNLGCKGAAIGTGIAQMFQILVYLYYFLRTKEAATYGTRKIGFNMIQVKEFLKLALPSGVGRFLEILAHVVFYRIVAMSNKDTMTCVILVQSLFMLLSFIIDGLAKGSQAIFANLYGAGRLDLASRVLKSSLQLHSILFVVICCICMSFTKEIAGCFFSREEMDLLNNPYFLNSLRIATLWMTVYFLMDGFCWVFFGIFTSIGDTKFVMYVNCIMNWLAYVLPVYIAVGIYKAGADFAWLLLATYNICMCLVYFMRFKQKIGSFTTRNKPILA